MAAEERYDVRRSVGLNWRHSTPESSKISALFVEEQAGKRQGMRATSPRMTKRFNLLGGFLGSRRQRGA
jgi:hypothetical protein